MHGSTYYKPSSPAFPSLIGILIRYEIPPDYSETVTPVLISNANID